MDEENKAKPVVMMLFALVFPVSLPAADWPMWRCDSGRTATSSEALKENLPLKWVRELPALEPAYRDQRLQFDAGYEPIAFGNRIFVGSSNDNSVSAFDADSGQQLWKFFTSGPVRFAPVGGGGRVIFGSDDGYVYCVRASKGDLVWKFKAVPLERKVIGNGRLISVWPVRGGPVLHEGKVYFAAGVWPLEGVFVYCLDAATGDKVWLNDSSSYIYGQHPHNTEAFGGLAPQGYLLVEGDDLVVPSSNAYPARFDLATGKLKEFVLPAPGRLPGGWFAASRLNKEARRGEVVFDSSVNQKRHEDKMREKGDAGIRNKITLKGSDFLFEKGYPGVKGTIYSAIAADGNLLITTTEGNFYCFGETDKKTIRYTGSEPKEIEASDRLSGLLEKVVQRRGFAVVLGEGQSTAQSIADKSEMKVISVQPDLSEIDSANGVHYISGVSEDFEMPPYFADLIVVNEVGTQLKQVYESVRPFGGLLAVPRSFEAQLKEADLPGAQIDSGDKHFVFVKRSGALEGATNYLGDWDKSPDALVKAPLGILWYGDQTSHFKRAPQPKFVNGVMISIDKDWTDASTRTGKVDYRLLPPKFTDIYTGRPLAEDEVPELRQSFSIFDSKTIQPAQYRPPSQTNDWKPGSPKAGKRKNPITCEEEARTFPKMYGCDGGVDYGNLYTMRSGTAAFYDLQNESGTVNISGPRSGCTNSIIPANGVLNVPYFYEGCTCSYPLPMGLSLISMPETFEQWMSWGDIPAEALAGKIERIGINFGAPGDRKTDDGTLWIDYPDKGGPSPKVQVKTVPENPEYVYRHSIWMNAKDRAWPWVGGSAAKKVKSVTISGIKPGDYEVRVTISAFDEAVNEPLTIGHDSESVIKLEAMQATTKVLAVSQDETGDMKLSFSREINLSGIEIIPTAKDS